MMGKSKMSSSVIKYVPYKRKETVGKVQLVLNNNALQLFNFKNKIRALWMIGALVCIILWSVIFGLVCALLILITLLYKKWKLKDQISSGGSDISINGDASRPRFRKRDKMLFYGRRMLRKVKSISSSGQGRKRRAVMRFARRLLQLKKEQAPTQLKVLEPPAEYLEEDLTSDERMPPDALYMLHSIRVFGHFEKPVFLKLCKHTEILNIPAGNYLFKIGDADENVYVVQNGKVNVFIRSTEGAILSLKVVKAGESVTSLLSFTDVLTGHPQPYKTVSARAIEDSQVIRLPMAAFQEVFQEYPDIFVRVMQIIMVRLQRVTFTALHQYLGLSAELVNPGRDTREKKHSTSFPPSHKSPQKKMSGSHEGTTSHENVTYSLSDTPREVQIEHSQSNSISPQPTLPSQLRSKQPDMVADITNPPQNMPDVSSHSKSVSSARAMTGKSTASANVDSDEQALLNIATEAFVKELGLENDTLLQGGHVQIREVPAGTYLMKEESNKTLWTWPEHPLYDKDVALVYLLSGTLSVSQRISEGDSDVHMFTAYPGEVMGGLAVLTGEPSFITIKAKHFSRIALLSKNSIYNIMRERPKIVLHIAHTVVKRLSPFVRQVDFALDWVFLESGRAVYRQDEDSDSTFIVLSGRLRSVITHPNGKKELVGEYGRGDLVGIVEMVTQTKRSTTVMAVRDSELAKLPEGLFNAIKLRFPVVVTRLINLLGHRILGSWQKPSHAIGRANAAVDQRPTQLNFSTVAIVPVSDDVPLTAFTYELFHSLCAIGPTLRLTSDVIRRTLGLSIMDPNNEYRLSSWLAQQEDTHKVVLYQCDNAFSQWTQRCVRQADCILIVGLGYKQPSIGKIEKEIERLAIRTQKELILLHREGGPRPHGTVDWLNMRSWVSSHHHVLCQNRMFTRKSQYRICELYNKVLMSEASVHSDFSRLARWLTGTSVGLVLGGGGARGAAHVGMIRAIQEAGIPIDMVGGVSIGAFMGALWCSEKNITTVTQKAREWSNKMTQWSLQLLDLTYPATSMFTGRHFNATIRSTFEDTHIEDLWLPYFTVTTDISASCMRVHRHGSLWRYVRASMSLSGYMPPLCDPLDGHLLLDGGYVNNLPGELWRYCRASMSVAGIFPPICDPADGHLLLDGCYINNVPADIMRAYGARHILAIDVGSQDDMDLTNYGDDLSGWWLLWKRWNPFVTNVKVPNIPDIQSRLAYVSCVRQLEEVKSSDYCEYIRPPIDKYRTLQFGSFDEIKDVGYQHGKGYFEGQKRTGALPLLREDCPKDKEGQTHHHQTASEYTFTDLAQMVCQVAPGTRSEDSTSESEDDTRDGHFEGYSSEPSAGILDDNLVKARLGCSLSENELDSDGELFEPKKMHRQ